MRAGKFPGHPTPSVSFTGDQLISKSGGGPLRFSGTLSEPATVTVGGNPAKVIGNPSTGFADVTAGTNTVAVTATDRNGLTTTNN